LKLAEVATAIRSRLTSDSTLTTLLGSSSNIRTGQVPSTSNISGNVVVMNLYGNGRNDTANKNIAALRCEFLTLVRLGPSGSGADSVFTIMDRIIGDGEGAATPSTYGLHRYEPTLSGATATSHKLTHMLCEFDFEPVDVPDPASYVAYSLNFTLYNQTL
jgi:hypothetical protein